MTLQTPLYQEHLSLGAQMISFGPWVMPVQYSGIVEEHLQTRQAVAMFDTCHMGEILIEGSGSLAYLENLVPRSLAQSRDGKCYYTQLCQDDGGILDDVILYRMNEHKWLMVVNGGTIESDFDWMTKHLFGDVQISNQSSQWAKIDVQGPEALTVLMELSPALQPAQELAYFGFFEVSIDGHPWIVSRTGYTGELGFELYTPSDVVVALWQKLLKLNVCPAGLGARDTLRLEMGYPLMGQDLDQSVQPKSVGFGHFVSTDKNYIGHEAMQKDPEWISLAFEIGKGGIARHGAAVVDNQNHQVGEVSSGTWSPTCQKAIGLARVPWSMRDVKELTIQIRNRYVQAQVVQPPFVSTTSVKNNHIQQRSHSHVSSRS